MSPARGVLLVSPALLVLLVLLPGIRRAWRAAPDWARAALGGGVPYFAAQCWVQGITGSDACFTNRYVIAPLVLSWLVLVLVLGVREQLSRVRQLCSRS